jgi:hypothetical protein
VALLSEFSKQHGQCVIPTHYPQIQKLAHWDKYLRHESHKLFTTGTSKVKLEKSMELDELGFYKNKNGFDGAITRPLRTPVENEVIIPHASTDVVHPQEMETFSVAEVIDPQEVDERSITIFKPTRVIYGEISLHIDIAQTKKAPAQVHKP